MVRRTGNEVRNACHTLAQKEWKLLDNDENGDDNSNMQVPSWLSVTLVRPGVSPTAGATAFSFLLLPSLASPWGLPLTIHFTNLEGASWLGHPR